MVIGRNEPCPCGSKKKFKLCCLRKGEGAQDYPRISQPRPSHSHLFAASDVPGATSVEQLNALLLNGCFADAERHAERLTHRFPGSATGWKLLAVARRPQGKDVVPALNKVLELLPNDRTTYAELWAVLFARGRADELMASFQSALAADPHFAEAHVNMGNLLAERGETRAAKEHFLSALAIRPHFAEAHFALGNLLFAHESSDAALHNYRQAISHKPFFIEALVNYGNALMKCGYIDEAIRSYQQALEATTNKEPLRAMLEDTVLGNTFFNRGRVDEAIAHVKKAIAQDPSVAATHGLLLFFLSHSDTVTAQELFSEHLLFAQKFELPLKKHWPPHRNPSRTDRQINVGFVSGDFRDHAVAHFLEPVLNHLSRREGFSLHAYYTLDLVDEVTLRMQNQFAHWHSVAACTDEELARKIADDGIDILIDLSGHTAHNRLLVFARKPAPVQISWIGYPNTTGLQAIDYVFCDRFSAPYGVQEPYYVEKFARLPSSTGFRPPQMAPEVGPLPALEKQRVTFGSFNRPEKLNESVIAAWSRVLMEVPDASMLLGNIADAKLAEALTQRFGAYGIRAERLTFRPKLAMVEYLQMHNEVDIILDTWPYTGGTTTNFALWMGVPVVTLRGVLRSHCQSAAAIGRCGLDDWIARDIDEFVRIATHWAQALPELAKLRLGLRERLATRIACRPEAVAEGVALALQFAWQRWSMGLPPEHFEVHPTLESEVQASEIR